MSLIEKLPEMTDIELATLKANADALAQGGSDKQKAAVAALMPALDAELSLRRERAAAERAQKPRRKAPTKRAKAKTVEKEEQDPDARELGTGAAE
jgi:hypothetical protein